MIFTLIAPVAVLVAFIAGAARMLELQAREQTRWIAKLEERRGRVVEDVCWMWRELEVLEAKRIWWRRNAELATEFTRCALEGRRHLEVIQ